MSAKPSNRNACRAAVRAVRRLAFEPIEPRVLLSASTQDIPADQSHQYYNTAASVAPTTPLVIGSTDRNGYSASLDADSVEVHSFNSATGHICGDLTVASYGQGITNGGNVVIRKLNSEGAGIPSPSPVLIPIVTPISQPPMMPMKATIQPVLKAAMPAVAAADGWIDLTPRIQDPIRQLAVVVPPPSQTPDRVDPAGQPGNVRPEWQLATPRRMEGTADQGQAFELAMRNADEIPTRPEQPVRLAPQVASAQPAAFCQGSVATAADAESLLAHAPVQEPPAEEESAIAAADVSWPVALVQTESNQRALATAVLFALGQHFWTDRHNIPPGRPLPLARTKLPRRS